MYFSKEGLFRGEARMDVVWMSIGLAILVLMGVLLLLPVLL